MQHYYVRLISILTGVLCQALIFNVDIICAHKTDSVTSLSAPTLGLSQSQRSQQVKVNLTEQHPVSPTLYGVFFEEIGHAGEGGIYAELIQDRSFDALAVASKFFDSDITRLPIDLNARTNWDIIMAWNALPGTQTALSKAQPMSLKNMASLEVSPIDVEGSSMPVGIVNTGFWGIHLSKDNAYQYLVYARTMEPQTQPITISLMREDLNVTYASQDIQVLSGNTWRQYSGMLKANGSDTNAKLVITLGPGAKTLYIDYVSLFPEKNVEKGKDKGLKNPWPFRQDLLDAVKDLKPSFLRFPGGCFIEGEFLSGATKEKPVPFLWKNAIGKWEDRPGHYGIWNYWSTDGLGLFEYMLLVEELETEPVWVINNGISHDESIKPKDILPWIQDALDSIEFITGPPDSTWGAERASMGHPEPWELNYMAIGNEDCGKQYYTQNYLAFYTAIKAKYPHMKLIANCDMGDEAPTELWDWHIYTTPEDMFEKRHEFDALKPGIDPLIFASEYAVTDGGGWGNLIGAMAEAGFMTGLERNSEAVTMAAYAPLFVHTSNRPWPTNMIVFNNHNWYGIPSYYVQKLFRETQGISYAATHVLGSEGDTLAASTTCQDPACSSLVVKLVNFNDTRQDVGVAVAVHDPDRCVLPDGELTVLTSDSPSDENSFDEPTKVVPKTMKVEGLSEAMKVELAPWSVTILKLRIERCRPPPILTTLSVTF